ncbi:hypothetical protein ACFR9T_16945 [Halorubrum laminariae]|uniref:ABC transporter permease n=2 Tax=Halorubrum laminariae TaxID=1433523 RepID=A0ABD6C4X3_9EURY
MQSSRTEIDDPMQPSKPSLRTIAIFGLLVVGVVGSFAFHAAVTDMDVTYTATAVQPGEEPSRVAFASGQIVDLDERLEDKSASIRQPVEHAAANGSFAGTVPPELHITLDDLETRYVVYEGAYYRWNLTVSDETTFVSIEMAQVTATTVLDSVATAYDAAPPKAKSAIQSGSVTGWNVERGIYRQGQTYYAVAPRSETAIAGKIISGFLGYALTPVGRGYVAVALGLLAYRYRNPLIDRPLTVQRSLSVAAMAVPVAFIGTLVFESGSWSRFVTGPMSALVVASGVVAGVLVHQRRWLALLGFTGLVAALVVGASVLALGVIGGLLGGLAVFVGLLTGVIPLGYGIAFGAHRSRKTNGDA